MSNERDLKGLYFNSWKVLYRDFEKELEITHKRGYKSPKYWFCECKCGNKKSVLEHNLISGLSKSCGAPIHRKSPSNFQDLRGMVFERLLVLERGQDTGKWQVGWNCVCSCGNLVTVNAGHLRSGHTRSCGCFQKDRAHETHFKDLTGKRFGKLKVVRRNVEYEKTRTDKQTYWDCECECGSKTIVTGGKLVFGHTQSCGCVSSFGELKVKEIFNSTGVLYKSNFTFFNCLGETGKRLKFDFGVFDTNKNLMYLIEFDGVQHFICEDRGWMKKENFERQQIRDRVKDKYCFDNNIPIIRIPYVMLNFMSIKDLRPETSNFILTKENEKEYFRKYAELAEKELN